MDFKTLSLCGFKDSWIQGLLQETNNLVSIPSKRILCALSLDFHDFNLMPNVLIIALQFDAIQILNALLFHVKCSFNYTTILY